MGNKTEEDIIKNWKGDISIPVVSICCATYNHVDFIVEALDSFLMQETDFIFEIIIRDDCSTDGTVDVIKKYVLKYPNIIKPIYEKENQFSKGIKAGPIMINSSKSKYIALCEGDDYWTDPLKLTKQIELLIKYPKAMMSVAYCDVYSYSNGDMSYTKTLDGNGKALQEFEDIMINYFHTSTYVVETDVIKEIIDDLNRNKIRFSDSALRYMLIVHGPFVLLPEVVSVYRVTGKGIWTSLNSDEKLEEHFILYNGLFKVLKGKYKKHFGSSIFSIYRTKIVRSIEKYNFIETISLFPYLVYYALFYKIPNKLGKIIKFSRKERDE